MTSSLLARESALSSISEYVSFLRGRVRWILGGTAASILLMAIVTATLPDIYSSWAVIETGTVGQRRGVDVDQYRDQFNVEISRQIIARFPAGSVSKIWIDVAPPYAMLRADANSGVTAQRAAAQAAAVVVDALARMPLVAANIGTVPGASERQGLAIRAKLAPIADAFSTEAQSSRRKLQEARRRAGLAVGELRALPAQSARSERVRAIAEELAGLIESESELDRRATALEALVTNVRRALVAPIPQRALPMLDRLPDLNTARTQDVEQVTNQLQELLSGTVGTRVEPVRISTEPRVPAKPSSPKRGLNLVIATLFGAVASTFVTILIQNEVDQSVPVD